MGLRRIYFPRNRVTKPLSSISFKIDAAIKWLGMSSLAWGTRFRKFIDFKCPRNEFLGVGHELKLAVFVPKPH